MDVLFDKESNCYCRICGHDYGEPAWGEDGKTPLYIICVCCGSEAGYQDYTLKAIRMNRQRWLDAGAHWSEPQHRPDDWNLEEQLKQIPREFW